MRHGVRTGMAGDRPTRVLTCDYADCRCSITTLHTVTRERATPGPGEWFSGGAGLRSGARGPRARTREPLPILWTTRRTGRVRTRGPALRGRDGYPRGVGLECILPRAILATRTGSYPARRRAVTPSTRQRYQGCFAAPWRAEPLFERRERRFPCRPTPHAYSRARCHATMLLARAISASHVLSVMVPTSALRALSGRSHPRQDEQPERQDAHDDGGGVLSKRHARGLPCGCRGRARKAPCTPRGSSE